MRSLLLVLALCILEVGAQTIRFAPLPTQKAENVHAHTQPMLTYLQERTHDRYTLRYAPGYETLLEWFVAGEIDVVQLGPLPVARLLEMTHDAKPLVMFLDKMGAKSYTCCLIARSDSPFSKPDGIRLAKSAALTQPLSTCGYLMSEQLLNEHQSTLKALDFAYTGSHTNTILSVLLGTHDIGGLHSTIARRYLFHGLKILAQSKEIPGFSLVVNTRTLPGSAITRLKEALLALDPLHNGEHRLVTASWDELLRYGAVPTDAEAFAYVRSVLKNIPLADQKHHE